MGGLGVGVWRPDLRGFPLQNKLFESSISEKHVVFVRLENIVFWSYIFATKIWKCVSVFLFRHDFQQSRKPFCFGDLFLCYTANIVRLCYCVDMIFNKRKGHFALVKYFRDIIWGVRVGVTISTVCWAEPFLCYKNSYFFVPKKRKGSPIPKINRRIWASFNLGGGPDIHITV